MSIPVPLSVLETFSPKDRRRIDKQLRVKEKSDPKSFLKNLKEVVAYRQEGEVMAFPFQWSIQHHPMFQTFRRSREMYDQIDCSFSGQLRPEQQTIQKEAFQFLNQQGSILIAVYPGGGKTITSLSICSKIRLKTLILVNRVVLMEQWKESVERFFEEKTKIQIVEAQDVLDPDAHFYVMNALNVPKRDAKQFERIGTVVVDECHMMITQVFIQSLSFVFPRYLIGLSATPYRPDGLDILLDLYFGTERILRQLFRRHNVYLVETGLKIEGKTNEQGKLSWNSVLQEQMEDERRNDLIVRLVQKFSDRSILVLCKRVNQIELLTKKLKEFTTTTTLKGNEVQFDKEARVLVASIQKVGTGFSHEKLDMLILACDTEEYFLQYLGRVFRRPDVVPIVVDIVDKNPVLRRHWRTRKKVYENAGGSILSFHQSFPEFPLLV